MSEQESATMAAIESKSPDLNRRTQKADILPILKGLNNLSVARQIGLMLGIAISIAVGIAVVLWSQSDSYDLLYSNMAEQDSSEIILMLDSLAIDYKIESKSGAIMVPKGDVRELKLKLAAQGLPRTQSSGYEILDKETSFGTSKNVELIRFQRALEGEIAKTISTIQNIKTARVLLALPKQSVFVRKRKKPSASVIVSLFQGRTLKKGQIEAIVHLVSSSVPMMDSSQVTVVDQKGRMLSNNGSSEDMYLTSKQFEYKNNIENHLMQRIENILLPLVGRDGMQAQITADVDFTVTEKTQEMFNPELSALRSEQTQDEQSTDGGIQGIPGALSNQPPPAGVAPEMTMEKEEGEETTDIPTSTSKSATRNFEIDKTITHTRLATGLLRRLSVAVVIDNKKIVLGDGTLGSEPYPQEDINQLRELIMQAVGFDNSRGDQVTVRNVAFRIPDKLEALPAIPLWEQDWILDIAKQLVAVLVVIFIIFGVLRPTMQGLVARDEEIKALLDAHTEADAIGGTVRLDENGNPIAIPIDSNLTGSGVSAGVEDLLLLDAPQSYEKRLEYIQKLIDEDSQLVSQILTGWIQSDV